MTNAGLDVAGLYAALDSKRQADMKSWRLVAKEAGVSPSTITRMKEGKRPDVDGFACLVRWLGMTADQFLGPAESKRKPRAEPAAEIMTYLRGQKQLDPDSVAAIEDLIQAACKRLKRTSRR